MIHPYDKLLSFGNNADNPNDLGAEISVKLGRREEHIFPRLPSSLCLGTPRTCVAIIWSAPIMRYTLGSVPLNKVSGLSRNKSKFLRNIPEQYLDGK